MLRILSFISFLALLLNTSKTQAQSHKQLINYADENAAAGDFYGASLYYANAMKLDSTDIHLIYKYATSLRKYNNYDLAGYYYNKVTEKDKGSRIYKDAIFWKSMMLKYVAEYKESSNHFKKTKKVYGKDKKGYIYLKSKQEVISCSYAKRQKSVAEDCSVDNIGNQVNTTNSEFSAFYFEDQMLFSSLRGSLGEELDVFSPASYKVAIYNAEKTEIWKTKSAIDTTINSILSHSANGCFDPKTGNFYFTKCDSLTHCEIYVSKYDGENWKTPSPLSNKINNTNYTSTQPNIAEIEGKSYLFFASDQPGGFGNLDLYVCEVLDGNTFTKPKNLGKEINTPDPEVSPFYHTGNKTLYFSSSWHAGFGGFDIFSATGKPDAFEEPENMLAPINSQWNDFYFSLDSSGQNGFLTSNRLGVLFKKGPTCCNDIWEVKFEKEAEDNSMVIESLDDLNKYLPVTLYFHNDRPGPRSLDTTVKDNYMITYDRYTDLQATYRKEYAKGLEGEQLIDAKLDIDDYFKNYVDKGVADLELFARLLLEELNKGQKIEITIKGFASPLAKSDYNVNLTKRRISTLINYLREYETGEYNQYMDKTAANGGELTFLKIPFGEYTANTNVSDDYYDARNSIYNRKAAVERKIEIQSITFANKDSIYAGLTAPSGTFDFGKVKQGDIVEHTFLIENTGNKPLRLIKVVAGCDCNSISHSDEEIQPGETGEIKVTFDTKNTIGKQVKSITVIADSFPRTKRLVLTAEVIE
ncbi:MAG: hypothetical protein ACI9N1_001155 [Flavobacteriales bacterium]|jgi:hypothetical protein